MAPLLATLQHTLDPSVEIGLPHLSRDRSGTLSPQIGRNTAAANVVERVVRRVIVWLMFVGAAALLAAWPLWHVVRPDASGCDWRGPCDPSLHLPFGSVATALTVGGGLVLLIATTLLAALAIRGVIRLDARERQARIE